MTSRTQRKSERILLATMTGEPFQPVRLYWTVPKRVTVTRVFTALGCVSEEAGSRAWLWLYQDEARAITFDKPYEALPPDVHPIHIGRFHMPSKPKKGRRPTKERLVMELRSFDRAIEAAKFFAPLFGSEVVLDRGRVINRLFEGHEAAGGPDVLDRLLDQNVVVKDPRDAERDLEQAMAGAHTPREKRIAFERYSDEKRKKDVPLVEDFPLWPEEETPEFRDLTMVLRLRQARAFEHWNGNPITLADYIHRIVEEGRATGNLPDFPVELR